VVHQITHSSINFPGEILVPKKGRNGVDPRIRAAPASKVLAFHVDQAADSTEKAWQHRTIPATWMTCIQFLVWIKVGSEWDDVPPTKENPPKKATKNVEPVMVV